MTYVWRTFTFDQLIWYVEGEHMRLAVNVRVMQETTEIS